MMNQNPAEFAENFLKKQTVKKNQLILINQFLMSKKFSFDNLMNENWDYVYGYILKQTNNTYLSEEITIQAFSKAFGLLTKDDRTYTLYTYITGNYTFASHNTIPFLECLEILNGQFLFLRNIYTKGGTGLFIDVNGQEISLTK